MPLRMQPELNLEASLALRMLKSFTLSVESVIIFGLPEALENFVWTREVACSPPSPQNTCGKTKTITSEFWPKSRSDYFRHSGRLRRHSYLPPTEHIPNAIGQQPSRFWGSQRLCSSATTFGGDSSNRGGQDTGRHGGGHRVPPRVL